MKHPLFCSLIVAASGGFYPAVAHADLLIAGTGNLVLAEEGGTFAGDNVAAAASAFALDLLGNGAFIPTHDIPNLNDGVYGNGNSWIGESPNTHCGISLGAVPQTVASIAFGRDNLASFGDRSLGLYTLQFTQVANPDAATAATGDAATGWADIGTLDYGTGVGGTLYQQPALRHRYNFDAVDATGIRIIVPLGGIGGGTAIDEIELYATPGTVQEPPSVVELIPSAGFQISYDGNDGDFFNQDPPPGGATAPTNLAQGGTAFGSSEFGGGGVHLIANVNDGYYGNSNSWISNFSAGDPAPSIGIDLGGEFMISAIAWGRDNGNGAADDSFAGTDCCGGQADDRSTGTYTVQITTDAAPSTTGNWTTVGTVGYSAVVDRGLGGGFTPWFRHQFDVATDTGDPLTATGVRLLVPNNGICIDELEIISAGSVPELLPVEAGGAIDTAANLADGAGAFAKDVLAGRSIGSLNDQQFGDASAWVGASSDSFAGISLGAVAMTVRSLAFGRDNLGLQQDRATGTYVLQATAVPDPDESTPDGDWVTIGTIRYEIDNPEDPFLRHRFNFPDIDATGIRLLTPDGAGIDELELYGERYTPPPPPGLIITPSAGFTATWDGNDGDFFDATEPPTGALAPDNLALAANGAVAFASSELGPELAIGYHLIDNLNDGIFGNLNSWISASANPTPQAFAGIRLSSPTALSAIAWGRDNGNGAIDVGSPGTDGGQFTDRSAGTYKLQFTNTAAPDADTPDGDWTTIAEFTYSAAPASTDDVLGGLFTEWLRHQFEIGADGGGAIIATGVRLLVPLAGLGGGTCIDEIELYGSVSNDPFKITAVSYDDATGEVSVTFNSQPGRFYALDASTSLLPGGQPGGWEEIDDGIEGAGATTTVLNRTTVPGSARRYFRIREF